MITAVPQYQYNSAYLPFVFQFLTFNNNMAYARVQVRFDSTLIDTKLVPPLQEFFGSTAFSVDLQRTLQLNMGTPQTGQISVFPRFLTNPTTQPYQAINPECYKNVDIIIEYFQYQNGLPVKIETETSPLYKALLGVRQLGELDDFTEYIPAPSPRAKFLTRRSDTNATKITRSQSLYLSFLSTREMNTFSVASFDKNNVLIDTAVGQITSPSGDQKTIGAGLPQLDYASWISGSFDPTNPNINSYIIEVGSGTFQPYTKRQSFLVVDDCKEGLEVQWLNDLGGGESYVFRTETIKELSSKGSFARSPLLVDPFGTRKTFDKGRFKFNNTETKVQYKCVSDFLTPVEVEYIKSLLYSMEVYAVIDGDFYSLQVEDGSFIEDNNNDFKTQLEITFTMSVDQYSMIR